MDHDFGAALPKKAAKARGVSHAPYTNEVFSGSTDINSTSAKESLHSIFAETIVNRRPVDRTNNWLAVPQRGISKEVCANRQHQVEGNTAAHYLAGSYE